MNELNLSSLPLDILYLICSYLPYSSCKQVSHLSSYLFNTFKENKHFSKLLKRGLQAKVLRLVQAHGNYNNVLTFGCKTGNIDIVKYCLPYTSPSPSAATIACMNGYLPILEAFLTSSEFVPTLDMLWLACECGYAEIVQYLCTFAEISPQAKYNEALIIACEKDKFDVFSLLLADPRVNPGDRNDYCFRYCCKHNMLPYIDILLQDGRVNPAARDNEAFIEACLAKNIECVYKLLAHPRVSPEARDNLALISCARQWNKEIVKLLWTDYRVRHQFKFCFAVADKKQVEYLLGL